MTAIGLVWRLLSAGCELAVVNGRLRVRAPRGSLSEADRRELVRLRDQIIALLGNGDLAPVPGWPLRFRYPDGTTVTVRAAYGIPGLADDLGRCTTCGSRLRADERVECRDCLRHLGPRPEARYDRG